MATPRFSILVPTRDRPETLRHTLATVAAQPGEDYEIVVADNCSRDETRALVEALGLAHLRYLRSDEVLPMCENWERGLALCTGEYVTVLGDDDGFLPSTLQLARRLIEATSAEVFAWMPHTYWWPDTIVPWNRNVLIVELQDGLSEVQSRPVLERFYRGELAYAWLPMIYQGFFHRGVIEEARMRYDGFFVPRDAAPDISSGILGLHLTERYFHSLRPLSIRGNSGKSNGTAQWARSLGARQREIYFREERTRLQDLIHPALIPSPDLNIIVANAKLKCREAYFPDDPALELDRRTVLEDMLLALPTEPEAYDERLADIRALAQKIGVSLDPQRIPACEPRARRRIWGPRFNADKSVTRINVDGDQAGLANIADAARLAESLVFPADTYLES